MSETPDWFWPAVETARHDATVQVADADIHYVVWEGSAAVAADRPGLLFVHGHNAHAHWWDFIAPSFLSGHRVAAIDLSGMGDSDHRQQYSIKLYVEEIRAVQAAAGVAPGILVAHSFGGVMAMHAAALFPELVSGLILVDSGVRDPDSEAAREREAEPLREVRAKVYPNKEAAISRFRLQPPQPCDNHFLVNYIAHHSVEPEDGGWVWKFDEELNMRMAPRAREPEAVLRDIACPVALIYGEHSASWGRDSADYMQSLLPTLEVIELADARHHLFLDQPLPFIDAVHGILGRWRQAASS